uniref:50S ribosomal protein L32 n=1 Tax=Lambia antarctica TaxID=101717 RepID=A0A1L2EDV8_9CHLO|nr:50S ribosomal protein L32 [Lambia antarctica]ANN39044.1 50S ribosomal protein L32 [Lambia antarctica]
MAVPKKRKSKTKKTIRKQNWKNKAVAWRKKALAFGLTILSSK